VITGFRASTARSGFALGLCTGLIVASAGFMLATDFRSAATASGPDMPVARPDGMGTPGTAGSMASATLALATRLSAQGGTDDQWNLLAQSYEFLGRNADADLARQHKVSASGDLRDAVMASASLLPGALPVSTGPASTSTNPAAAAALLDSAERHRRKREFGAACADYARLAKLGGMNADAWADYADASAALTGSLAGEPERYLDEALALDPRSPKALWLKASLQHEQRRYKDAVATWKRLLAVVPAGSSDARIVEANIAEASRLGSG
jgi:cytochrome c-type biogenesis protein CcmH/NrfG